jgi:hypothetical protein
LNLELAKKPKVAVGSEDAQRGASGERELGVLSLTQILEIAIAPRLRCALLSRRLLDDYLSL